MFKRLWQWINERWPAKPVIQTLLTEEIPGGATIKFSFGACVLSVFIVQAATGLMQLFFYAPTADHAYISLSFLRTEVPFGWLIHNLHYWGATAMLVLVLVHMTQVFLWGAYKSPRELVWLLGSVNFLLAMLMMFAGSPLPWDEKGYWSTEVGTSIAGTVPLIGDLVKRILRGGEAMGQPTLSRFFVLHVAILPALLITFITLHIVAFRRFGCVGPWQEAKRTRTGPFWPDQLFKDLIMIGGIVFILLTLAVFVPPDFAGPADPLDTSFVPKSQWNFLFLFQALKYFPGRLEAVGTVGIPLVIILLLVSAPFVDRRKERNPAKRPLAVGVLVFVAAVVIGLSVMGSRSEPGESRTGEAAKTEAAAGAPAVEPSSEGEQLVKTLGCLGCHTIGGEGGKVGPDLSAEGSKGRSREWLAEQIINPKSHNPASVMPAFNALEDRQLNALVQYLQGLKSEGGAQARPTGPVSSPAVPTAAEDQTSAEKHEAGLAVSPARQFIGNPRHGAKLFRQHCESCHGPQGKGGVVNPGSDDGEVPALNPIDEQLADKEPARFVAKIDPYIQNGETPPGPQPALKMPAFGRSLTLTQAQISHLETYILNLNGVRRDESARPGLRPATFFVLAVIVFGLGIFFLAVIRLWKFRR
jgi:ubiquinol-cytochrome c reductase cytochrome b subunit